MVEVVCVDPTFIVHFKDRNVTYANGFARLLANEKQCDLTFLVEGKTLKAHRHILSFISQSLKAQFDTLHDYGFVKIEWQGGSYEMVKNVLYYIYNGIVQIKQSELEGFVQAAQWLDIGTSLQDLNLEAILATQHETTEIIWDSCGEEFVKGFQKFYAEKKFFDVTLQVEGKELQAHRQALSACSTYFEAMFDVCDIDKPVHVVMDANVTYESMQNILHYIYFGEVTVNDMIELLNSGEILEISGLERADDIEAERPSDDKPNVFHVHSSSKKNTRAVQPLIIKMKLSRSKGALKADKSRQVVYETDSEGSIYDPDEDSDNGGIHSRQRRTSIVRNVKPTKVPITRQAQKRAVNPFALKKLAKVPAQMMNKARASSKQPQPTKGGLRRAKQINTRVKPGAVKKSVNDASDIMNITLTQDEFQQLTPICDPIDENLEQGEGAVGFLSAYDEEGDAILAAPVTLKRKRGDRNNNKRDRPESGAEFVDYNEFDSPKWEFDEPNEYEYGSDGEEMIDSTVSYGDNVYVEDLTVDPHDHCQTNQELASNDATYVDSKLDKQLRAADRKLKVAKSKIVGEVGGKFRGVRNNAAPRDDNGYNVVANFIGTKRSARVLAHGGHRYAKSLEGKSNVRWICTRTGRCGDQCSAKAYTKDIDKVTKANLPPDSLHTHDPKYTADME